MRRAECRDGESGLALIETAIVAPFLILLMLGIWEFSNGWQSNLAIQTSVRAGARTGSGLGNDRAADYAVLQAVKAGMTDFATSDVQTVVVYKASAVNGDPPPGCLTGTSSSALSCNVYTPASFDEDQSHFGCKPTYNVDRFYCPSDRKVVLTAANGGPPDVVGVWIKMHHAYYTKFIADSVTLTDQAVIAVEPRRL